MKFHEEASFPVAELMTLKMILDSSPESRRKFLPHVAHFLAKLDDGERAIVRDVFADDGHCCECWQHKDGSTCWNCYDSVLD